MADHDTQIFLGRMEIIAGHYLSYERPLTDAEIRQCEHWCMRVAGSFYRVGGILGDVNTGRMIKELHELEAVVHNMRCEISGEFEGISIEFQTKATITNEQASQPLNDFLARRKVG